MTTKTTIRVEQYQFIDNLEHIIAPEEMGSYYTDKVNDVKNAFLKNGWEGDGEIGLIWIPPFIENTGDTFGSYVWHVKQNNNGISFLGYEETEFFDNGVERNIKKFEEEHITITYDNTRGCLDIINKYKTNLDSLIMFDKNIESQDELYHITLNAIQNNIVASFIDCIDEIYLNLLKHVFDSQNSDKLKLSKANVKLPLDEISKSDCEYIDSWLIIQQIESAIWRDFKFKPFKEKFREICSAVDFKCNEDLRKKIICHVEIRNSFQHHEGQLTSDMIKMVGQDHIDLLDESGKAKRFEKWNLIILSIPEVRSFCDSLEIFIRDYEKHIGTRMKDRHIRYKQNSIPVIESDSVNNEVAAESCNSEFVIKNRKMELIDYIYYLQYTEEEDDIVVKTKDADFYVYESSTFKVNWEECTSEEFYTILLSLGELVSCNGYEFEYNGSEFLSKEALPIKEEKGHSNIIQL